MANEAEKPERQPWLDRANKELTREIADLLADVHKAALNMPDYPAVKPITETLAGFASLLGALYIKAEIQTRRIIRLTWALVALTAALFLLTVYLCYDAHLKAQRENKQRNHQSQPHISNG